MSIGTREKHVFYDNPCAPIVRFSPSNSYSNKIDEFDDEDMTDDPTSATSTNEPTLGLGDHHSLSLEDLVQSFDQTIEAYFADEEQLPIIASKGTPVTSSNTWSDLIANLRTSLRHDLKLPQIAERCQRTMFAANAADEDILSIDGGEGEDDDELREQLDMHSVILSTDQFHLEPFLTAEQVISEIDFMLQDMTPDSGYCDEQTTADLLDFHNQRLDCFERQTQSIDSLHECIEELNRSIKDLSSILVQELAIRDELDYDKETKNTFISLVLSIQNKRQQYQGEKRHKRRSLLSSMSSTVEPGTYLTTVIPYDREHPTYLSVEHLQSLNKIMCAIHDDSRQVPELLTNYILKVLCPC